jgi:ferredoxin-NADP reductase
MPMWRTAYHRLRVVKVVREADDVFSLVVKGRRLERLAVSGGQHFQWRFMARGLRLHAHPYSISALPQPPYMRVTVKGLGAHSSAAARLSAGTRIAIEGPYGAFTKHALTGRRVALIAAGVGVTPVRSLLEDLPPSAEPVVLLRALSEEEMLLGNEVLELTRARGGRVLGPAWRRRGSTSRASAPRPASSAVPLPGRSGAIAGQPKHECRSFPGR